MRFFTQRRQFKDLSEQEVLALAISSEEDDARIYRSYAEMLRVDYPDTAQVFDGMALEEDGHRQALISAHRPDGRADGCAGGSRHVLTVSTTRERAPRVVGPSGAAGSVVLCPPARGRGEVQPRGRAGATRSFREHGPSPPSRQAGWREPV